MKNISAFDVADAHVWLNQNKLLAGVKMLLGVGPNNAAKKQSASSNPTRPRYGLTRSTSPPSTASPLLVT